MADTITVGLVGLGGVGVRHFGTLSESPGTLVGAVADLDEKRTEEVSARGPVGYQAWEDLLESEAIDALFVCTPPAAHVAPALAALERGIHVFVEKPIARRLEDARVLVEAARSSGAVAAMGYQWRAIDFLNELRAELAEQRLGLLSGRSIGPAPLRPWFISWEAGGGILLELASHDIDLQRALAGEVVSVQAAAGDVPIAEGAGKGVRSVLSITLAFESGAVGAIQVAWLARDLPTSWKLDLVSDRGAFYIDLDPDFRLTGRSNGREMRRKVSRVPSEANVTRFLDAVRAKDPGLVFCNLEEGGRTLEVALACERALETGDTVLVEDVRSGG